VRDETVAQSVGASPPGSGVGTRALGWVAVCIILSGLLTYGYLALVARAVPVADYGWFGSYWSLALVIGFGAFLPVELELARLLQLRPAGARLPAGTLTALAVAALACAALLLVAGPTLVSSLGGETGFLLALLCVCAVSAGQFLLRGLLLGSGRLGLHGTVLVVDSGLRVALAAGLGWWSSDWASDADGADYAWTLVVAMAVAHLPLLAWVLLGRRRTVTPRPAADDGVGQRPFLAAIGHLLIGTLCAQVLLNAAPILVSAAAGPGEAVLAAQFVASYTLVRLPLFVAVPLQSAMIPVLTRLQTEDDGARLRGFLARGLVAVVALALAALAVGLLLGPWVVGLVFGREYALSGGAIAVLAIGSVLHLGLLIASQALVAAARHRRVAVVWLSGLAVAGVLFAAVPDLVLRVSLAFTVGSGAALVVAAVALLSHRVTRPGGTGAPSTVAAEGGSTA
jgi:O-antigen/teichoic acid export membrane protein